MFSTAPAIARSIPPEPIPTAPKWTACKPERQKRLSVVPVISIGYPAARTAFRAMFASCSLACEPHPTTTSSPPAGSRLLRRASAIRSCPKSSCGWMPESECLAVLPDRVRCARRQSRNSSTWFVSVPYAA